MMRKPILAMLTCVLAAPAPGLRAQELVMFEEPGCGWCARWDQEISRIYPKTPEGKAAPLRRVQLHAPWPEDLSGIGPVTYTPTFVLYHDGREVRRIEGYPGEAFFWGLLGMMLTELSKGDAS